MADACVAASESTGDLGWLDRAEYCLRWFAGQNDLRVRMIDPSTRGCYDGLFKAHVNRNQGAESVLVWIIATLNVVGARQECLA